jgi:hypothetical protein
VAGLGQGPSRGVQCARALPPKRLGAARKSVLCRARATASESNHRQAIPERGGNGIGGEEGLNEEGTGPRLAASRSPSETFIHCHCASRAAECRCSTSV